MAAGNGKPERRQLTVLFCDMVGSTALSARLDPEDMRAILHAFQRCCSEAVARYDGHIAHFLGDGVLAYFGFPLAHEDDAERAVNTALAMVEKIGAAPMPAVDRVEVRVGIATGLVVVGDVIGEWPMREFALIGEAPNLAARLQQLAQPNQILVAAQTRRLLGRLFELEDLGAHEIRGLAQAVPVWRVVGPSRFGSRFEAHRPPPQTPLVGRGAELDLLLDRLEQARRGAGQVVVMSGEAGIGKSRLMLAFRQRAAGPACTIMTLQCSSYHVSSAWHPVIRLLEYEAGIERDMPPAERLERLEHLLSSDATGRTRAAVPLLASLLSIPTADRYPPLDLTPQQLKNRTIAALLAFFEARARAGPLVLVVEDVHWIDPSSMELLERLRGRQRDWPVLLVLLGRPEFTLVRAEGPRVSLITLQRLGAAEVGAMIGALAGSQALPRAVVEQIAARSDGVPLFVEEMTRAVLDSGIAGQEGAPAGAAVPAVPATLHESLMARLDQSASVKTVAQAAAAIGRDFPLDLLEAIVPLPRRDVRAAVRDLLASGLVREAGSPSGRSCIFKHALVQEEAYGSLLREERQALARRIAEALCTRFAALAEGAPEIVAMHFARGGRSREAIDYWLKAAQRASQRSAFLEATAHLRAALERLGDLPPAADRDRLELQLRQTLSSALSAAKGVGAAETVEAFRSALALGVTMPDSPQTFAVLNGMISVHVVRGEFEQSRELAEDLLRRAEKQADTTPMLMGRRALGMSLFLIGELRQAREQLAQAALLYDEARHAPLALVFSQDFKATALAYLSLACVLLGDVEAGLRHGQAAVSHAEHLKHPHSLCYALSFLAGAFVLCRDAEKARPIAERVLALSRDYDFRMWLAGGSMVAGWARVQAGEVEAGLAEIRGCIEALQQTTALIWVDFARYLLAQALGDSDRPDEALGIVDSTLHRLQGTRGRWYAAELHRLKGDLILRRGGPASAAEACYEHAISVARRQDAWLWELRAATSLAALWEREGKAAQVLGRLGPLCDRIDSHAALSDVQQARAVLERRTGRWTG